MNIKVVEIVTIVWALVCIGLAIAAVCVVVHFVGKYW